ncbi:hypothetical protein QM012_008554 [Aureobasidium pullulans]|uniref:Transcription factor domain-containing protein n=1 Tax=Aureobasidium pullulans TaxID=5580 RepID=A0ABR0TK24_AURPU
MPVLTNVSVNDNRVIRRICLPEREEARILFQAFAKSLGSWYHIYHKRSVEILLDKTYYQIACGHNPGLSQVALLLSIFASGAYFQASMAWPESIFTDPRAANQLSTNWKQNTLDILDHIEQSTVPTTMEQLQATIILSLMIQNFEALDLCFNKSATEAEDQSRRAELKEACLMLEESKTEMPAANRFLTPLMELLRKHKIQLQDAGVHNQYLSPPESTTTPNVQKTGTENRYPRQSITAQAQNVSERDPALADNPDLDFDGLWQEFINMVPDSSAPGWDDLLADFDQASLFIGV